MIETFLKDIESVAEKVRAHDLLDLLGFRVDPPAAAELYKAAEERWQTRLPLSVRRFYEITNGVSLQWRFKPDLPEDVKNRIRAEFDPLTPTPDTMFRLAGSIGLQSLDDVLINDSLALPRTDAVEGTFDFDGRVYSDNEFCKMLRPFDFIEEYVCMAFVVQPTVTNWKMMLLGDYWIEYDVSRVTWLEDYLQFITATFGLISARWNLFSKYRGDRDAPLTFNPDAAAACVPAILANR